MKKQKAWFILTIICLIVVVVGVIIEGILVWTDNYSDEEENTSEETYITCITD